LYCLERTAAGGAFGHPHRRTGVQSRPRRA